MKNSISIEDMCHSVVLGVKDVKSFNDKEVVLILDQGEFLLKGENFKIKRIDKEKGELYFDGKINSLTLKGEKEKLFKKVFK